METRLYKRFFKLTALNILSNITVPLVGLVDTGMLGHLPRIEFLAGVALASILFSYIYWTFAFLRMGTQGSTAQERGRGDDDEAHRVLYRSLALAFTLSLIILVIQVPLREIGFLLISGTPEVEEAGRSYFNARIWGAPAALANFAFLGWYLGREQSGCALLITVVGNLANVVLDYVFIFRLGWAAMGAGLATMLSQYIMLAVALAIFFSPSTRRIVWRWRELVDQRRFLELMRLNRDILIRTLCLISSFAIFENFSSMLGTQILAANTVLLQMVIFAAFLIDGAAFATQSLAGHFLGAAQENALRALNRLGLWVGEAFVLLLLGTVLVFRREIFALLTSHTDVVELAIQYSWWLVPVLCCGALAYIYDGLFLGLSAGRPLRNMMLLATLVVFLPVAVAALYLDNNHLLWAALALFMLARASTLARASQDLLRLTPPPRPSN